MRRLDVVVGAQFGSEAKGHMVQRLTEVRAANGPVLVVRVAGPNAGHTGHGPDGTAYAFRQLPVAAVVPGEILLGIAPGSEIDVPVLVSEIVTAQEAGLLDGKRLLVSAEATIITDEHKAREAEGELTARLGSTGKGIGAARADRIMRTADTLGSSPSDRALLERMGVHVVDDPNYFAWLASKPGWSTIIEGTQGYGLGLHSGYYPKTTSSDCRAIDFLAMAGLSPWAWDQDDVMVWLVARVYPIRVAGNSGPLRGETTWAELGLQEERTTVTQKVRRVGRPDWGLVRAAARANGGGSGSSNVALAVFMMDQMFPQVAGSSSLEDLGGDPSAYLEQVQSETGLWVGLVGTGPNSAIWTEDE